MTVMLNEPGTPLPPPPAPAPTPCAKKFVESPRPRSCNPYGEPLLQL